MPKRSPAVDVFQRPTAVPNGERTPHCNLGHGNCAKPERTAHTPGSAPKINAHDFLGARACSGARTKLATPRTSNNVEPGERGTPRIRAKARLPVDQPDQMPADWCAHCSLLLRPPHPAQQSLRAQPTSKHTRAPFSLPPSPHLTAPRSTSSYGLF